MLDSGPQEASGVSQTVETVVERGVPSDRPAAERGARPGGRPKPPSGPGGGLRVYKAGQGYYTRVWTAIGGGILIIWGSYFTLDELRAYLDPNWGYFYPLQYGISVGLLVVLSLLLYWVVGTNRKSNDFFIATEGEMKKVSWSSRQEVIRSTKVVIVTVILLGVFLFLADILFMEFFSAINVLRIPSILERLLGSGS